MLAPKMGRRAVGQGLNGVPLAAILANPTLDRAAAPGLQPRTITTPGGTEVSAVLALPIQTPAPAVLLIDEWWS